MIGRSNYIDGVLRFIDHLDLGIWIRVKGNSEISKVAADRMENLLGPGHLDVVGDFRIDATELAEHRQKKIGYDSFHRIDSDVAALESAQVIDLTSNPADLAQRLSGTR